MSKPKLRKWTANDDSLLYVLAKEGTEIERMAEKLDRSERSIVDRARTLGMWWFTSKKPELLLEAESDIYESWLKASRNVGARQ